MNTCCSPSPYLRRRPWVGRLARNTLAIHLSRTVSNRTPSATPKSNPCARSDSEWSKYKVLYVSFFQERARGAGREALLAEGPPLKRHYDLARALAVTKKCVSFVCFGNGHYLPDCRSYLAGFYLRPDFVYKLCKKFSLVGLGLAS